MANYPRVKQTLDEIRSKLQRIDAVVKVLESTIHNMEQCELSEIHPTHVGQAVRAVQYLESYASAATEAFLQARKPK